MQEVQVLEAIRTAPNSRGKVRSNPITVERIRVADYVRVSTDDDDQLGSFESRSFIMKKRLVRIPNGLTQGFWLMRQLLEPRPTSEPDFRK